MARRGPAASRTSLVFIAAAMLAVLAASTALYLRVSGEESTVIPQQGDAYVEGVTGTWERVNPLFSSDNPVDQDLVQLVFSGLVRVGPDGAVEPDLAELPDVSEGGRTYTFEIREGARWHDGEPVDSGDVRFTIENVTSAGFRGSSSLAAAWDGVEVSTPDSRTIELRLPEANAPFLARHATLPIVPEHHLEDLSGGELFDAGFNAAPIGSGPYRATALTADGAELTAFEDFYRGEPGIDTLRLRFFGDYPEAIQALDAGEIDGLLLPSGIDEARQEQVDDLSGVVINELVRPAYMVMYLNNDAAQFFQDERVRRAISMAIDREALVEEYFGGHALPSSSPVAPGSWAYDEEYDQPEVDIDGARALLEQAGWEQRATSPVRVRLGSEFRITIRTDNDPARSAVAAEIARQLEPLGIRANVATTSFSVLRRDYLQERRYEAAISGWEQGMDPDPYFGWHSSQLGSAGLNIANYSDAVADRLIEEGRVRNNPQVRNDMYVQLQEIWQRSIPSVVLAYPQRLYLQRDGIESSLPALLGEPALRFMDIHDWRRS